MIRVNGVPLTEIVAAHQHRLTPATARDASLAGFKARIKRGEISRQLTETEIHEITNEWLKAQSGRS